MGETVLVCGEALIDLFEEDASAGPIRLAGRIGGSPANVAIGLARLGRPTRYLGALSTDAFGQRLADALTAEGVDIAQAPRVAAPTTLSLVARRADGQPAYAFYGAGGADRQLSETHLPERLDDLAALHLGSYALVTPPTADTLSELSERAAGRVTLCLDPNVRLGVEPDAGVWRARVFAHAARADCVKLSDEDAAALDPDAAPRATAERLAAAGGALVVLTSGAGGAAALSRQGWIAEPAAALDRIEDTVGAGDAFQAALIDGLGRLGALTPGGPAQLPSRALATLLRRASVAAALCCARPGAEPPRRAELDAALSAGG